MSWFYVDDEFTDCEKLEDLPPRMLTACVGLWTLAGAWSRRNLTGGDVPGARVTKLGGTRKEAELLVLCGLWERTEHGYRFHDWGDWQETPEEVEHKRELSKQRSRTWRQKRAASRRDASVTEPSPERDELRDASVSDAGVPGEGEGDSTYRLGTREYVVEPLPPTGDAALDATNADLGLKHLRAVR